MRRGLGAAIAAIAAIALAGTLATIAGANFPGRSGRIAFSSTLPAAGKYRVQTIRPNGTGAKTIFTTSVSNTLVQGRPTYSADGDRIALDIDGDIYIINSDGTNAQQLTGGPARDLNPAFSPSGSRLIFTRTGGGADDIYSVDDGGGNLTQLTTDPGHDYEPTWSSRGLVAFVSNRSGSSHVWLMRSDGSHQHILVPDKPHRADGQVQPEFSPDGRRIAVSRGAHLVTMRLDGSHRVVLNHSSILIQPTYSPDGRKVAAMQAHRGNRRDDILVMNTDGSRKHKVRSGLANLTGISWQPLPRH